MGYEKEPGGVALQHQQPSAKSCRRHRMQPQSSADRFTVSSLKAKYMRPFGNARESICIDHCDQKRICQQMSRSILEEASDLAVGIGQSCRVSCCPLLSILGHGAVNYASLRPEELDKVVGALAPMKGDPWMNSSGGLMRTP